jgi:hypothetical protein
MEDRPLDIPDDNGAVRDTRGDTGGKTAVDDVLFTIYPNLTLCAEVLDIIIVIAEEPECFIEIMGVLFTEFDLFRAAGHEPLGLRVKFRAGDGIGVHLDDRPDDLGIILDAVGRIFSVFLGSIYSTFCVFSHFSYLFLIYSCFTLYFMDLKTLMNPLNPPDLGDLYVRGTPPVPPPEGSLDS